MPANACPYSGDAHLVPEIASAGPAGLGRREGLGTTAMFGGDAGQFLEKEAIVYPSCWKIDAAELGCTKDHRVDAVSRPGEP